MQLNIPELQCYPSRQCVVCMNKADQYCGRCGVTPYCSEGCQRRDWIERHRDVCHNLIRSGAGSAVEPKKPQEFDVGSQAAALRRPRNMHSDDSSDKSNKARFIPDGKSEFMQARKNNNNNRFRNNNNKQNSRLNNNVGHDDETWDGNAKANLENKQSAPKPNGKINDKLPDSGEISPDIVTIPPGLETKPSCSGIKSPGFIPKSIESAAKTPGAEKKSPGFIAKPPGFVPKSVMATKLPNAETKSPGLTAKSPDIIKSPQDKMPEKSPKVEQEIVTPKQKVVAMNQELIPKHYIIEKLSPKDVFLLSVDCEGPDGFVCLAMHEDYEESFNMLCTNYSEDCEKDSSTISPTPGEVFSYLNPEDGCWYRARCISSKSAILLDGSKTVDLKDATCKPLNKLYAEIPEFSVVLKAKVKVGINLKCTLLSKTTDGFKVAVLDEDDNDLGCGLVTRWSPPVVRETVAKSTPIPTVPRPPLRHKSRVLLLDVTSLKRACVRPASTETSTAFDSVLQDVIMYSLEAKPLKEPPQAGQTVISKFTDDVPYRALVKRTSVKLNKYLIEYIDFGNEEITTLERLYPCPSELDVVNSPPKASIIQLCDNEAALTPPASEYITNLRENAVELILTVPTGEGSVPNGSLVSLTVSKNGESVNSKLEEMCTPDWQKLEKKGGDVVETTSVMYDMLKYVKLPLDREFVLEVIEFESLESGAICGYTKGEPMAEVVYEELTKKMNAYCESELCKEPYLPKIEELCITKYAPFDQWFRAVLVELPNGPGSAEARVLYIDYGNMATVPVKDLRKMLPEFVENYPALATHVEIEDFPKNPTTEQLSIAVSMMNINEEGRGTLHVKKCSLMGSHMYQVQVPGLIAAMKQAC